jgi:hypothetical protein
VRYNASSEAEALQVGTVTGMVGVGSPLYALTDLLKGKHSSSKKFFVRAKK